MASCDMTLELSLNQIAFVTVLLLIGQMNSSSRTCRIMILAYMTIHSLAFLKHWNADNVGGNNSYYLPTNMHWSSP